VIKFIIFFVGNLIPFCCTKFHCWQFNNFSVSNSVIRFHDNKNKTIQTNINFNKTYNDTNVNINTPIVIPKIIYGISINSLIEVGRKINFNEFEKLEV
jgi:hypothetical protein